MIMKSRLDGIRIVALALLAQLCLGAAGLSASERPNIVYIISDDHDYEHLGFMGNEFVHTPTLDRMASQGALFTTAHLPMSRCHPTLASFLSGRWPHQSGIYYNYGEKQLAPTNSLPSLLKGAGYATYVEGKFWEGDPRAMGFTHGAGKTAQKFVRKGQDDLFSFIDAQAGKQPFFIWWAPLIPHTPHNPPQEFIDLHDWSKMPVPSYRKGLPNGPKAVGEGKGRGKGGWHRKEKLSYAMEAWLDFGVSKLVSKLQSAGELENTLFVFVIDNGWCNGLPSKGSPFEKGVRTPVFFSLPGTVPGGKRFEQLVSTNDIYPTILEYAGVEVPATASGRSLRPTIEGKGDAGREALFGAIYPAFATKGDNRPERDVYALYMRTAKWKYILYTQDVRAARNGKYFRIQSIECDYPERDKGDVDLYDLEEDPYEQRDLSADPQHSARLEEMKAATLKWWKDTGGKEL